MICELCNKDLSQALWYDDKLFIINVKDPLFPGYVRVIWRDHVTEVSDLSEKDQKHLFDILNVVERVMRDTMNPDKVNWAQFGNMVPHLHWHIIPRYKDDTHFPESIWGVKQRECCPNKLQQHRDLEVIFFKELLNQLEKNNFF